MGWPSRCDVLRREIARKSPVGQEAAAAGGAMERPPRRALGVRREPGAARPCAEAAS